MLELFAGTLNRYYCDVDTPEEAARTNEIVCHWRDTIVGAVKKAAPEAEPWEENTEKDIWHCSCPRWHSVPC